MELINAHQDGHRNLYHYQSLKGDGLGFLEQTLQHRTIHMSKPSSFNDPWDCKPWFNSSILDDPQERERHLEWLLRTAGAPADAPPAEEMRANPLLLKAVIEQVRDGHIKAIDDQYRVYCLSSEATIPLMWAHYGDNHRGVALEFDARADQLVGAYKVYYSATYPTQPVYTEEDNASLVPIYTKSNVWAYEHEYRLIAEERLRARQHMLNTVDSNLRLARGSLIGILMGCQCNEDAVLDLMDRYGRDLRIRRAVRVMDRYDLNIETVNLRH
jgi:hypothetical protein